MLSSYTESLHFIFYIYYWILVSIDYIDYILQALSSML